MIKYICFVSFSFRDIEWPGELEIGNDVIEMDKEPDCLDDIHTMENTAYSRLEKEGKLKLIAFKVIRWENNPSP